MIPPSCCPQSESSAADCTAESAFQLACDKPLLKWIHSQADLLSIIGYWCLFPLKLIFIAVLRKEMAEIFVEIYKAGNQELFRLEYSAIGLIQIDILQTLGRRYGPA
jgi:hypothetical protein